MTCTFIEYLCPFQLSSSGVTGGGGAGVQSAPQRLLNGKFLLTYREKWQGKKWKGGKKRRKIENGRREKFHNDDRTFFFFFFFFFAFHFSKRLKFVLGVPKWKFSTRKKSGKMTLAPHKNFPVTPLLSSFWPPPWFDSSFISCLASDLLLCPVHKKLKIWE